MKGKDLQIGMLEVVENKGVLHLVIVAKEVLKFLSDRSWASWGARAERV
jgi:hypothetical protein